MITNAKQVEAMRAANTKHGMSGTSEHNIWMTMRARCSNPKHNRYPLYGGRGIKVCDRWQDFGNFIKDMGRRPSQKHTIERIDSQGDYEPSNCRWATQKEQQNNRTNNVRYLWDGESLTLSELAERYGKSYHQLYLRINRRGWSLERALTE